MFDESKRVVRLTVLTGLLMPCILTLAVSAAAQGWGSGTGSSNKSPNAVVKSSAPSGRSAKSSKSARASRTGNKTTNSGHEKGAGISSDSAANKGKRERRVSKTTAAAKTPESPANKTENNSTASAVKAPRAGKCDPEKEERTDLSGTYYGTIKYPAAGLDGGATLSITGNRFTLTSDSKSESGNITAVTTCNYTAVAMMFGEWKTPQPGDPVLPPLPMLSLRAIRNGDQFRLIASPSEKGVFSFDLGQKK